MKGKCGPSEHFWIQYCYAKALSADHRPRPYRAPFVSRYKWTVIDLDVKESQSCIQSNKRLDHCVVDVSEGDRYLILLLAWSTYFQLVQAHFLLLLNTECNDMLVQMMKSDISPIAYSLDVTSREKMEEQTSELLRTAQMLTIKTVIVCSPRDYRQRIIGTVLNTVRTIKRLLILIYSLLSKWKY